MTETDRPDEIPAPLCIGSDDIDFITRAVRGIGAARVRFHETDRAFQEEFVALLLALEVSAQSESIQRIAPPPHRRYSIQYSGAAATITVSQRRPLLG